MGRIVRKLGAAAACLKQRDDVAGKATGSVVQLLGASLLWLGLISAWAPAAWSQEQPLDAAASEQLIAELGLRESSTAVREAPGWKKPTRVVIRGADPQRLAWLGEVAEGVELVTASRHADALRAVTDAQAVIGYCSRELLDAGEDLHWIQLSSAGAERCLATPDVRERRMVVTNMQRIYGPEIAEHAMAMLLAFTRGLYLHLREQHSGEWNRRLVPRARMWELTDKTMLVVGLGGIGTEVAKRAHAWGMRIIATRRSSRSGPDYVDYVGLADEVLELARQADAVVNATPLTPATTGLFDAGLFEAMKPTAYFINVGRGKSVVTEDLVTALRRGKLAGAGLDVTDPEPLPPEHPLWQMSNVIITPHIAVASDLRMERYWFVVRENLRRYVAGDPMLSVVNLERGY